MGWDVPGKCPRLYGKAKDEDEERAAPHTETVNGPAPGSKWDCGAEGQLLFSLY